MPISGPHLASSLNEASFNLILLPTEQCNFRCTYCYEDFTLPRMSETLVQAIERFLSEKVRSLDTLSLSWFGGEPLMAKDIVYRLSTFCQRLADNAGGALNYTSNMTTNAYLLDLDTATRLQSVGVREFQVSLDGWEMAHDQTRRRQDGRGTFHRIWANLSSILESNLDVKLLLRVHLTPENGKSIEELLLNLVAKFAGDSRVEIFLKAVEHLGGPQDSGFSTLGHASAEELRAELDAIFKDSFTAYRTAPIGSTPVCYASRRNSLVIRSNGRLAKCTVAFADPFNDVGHLEDSGELVVEATKLARWVRGFASLNDSELACPLDGMPPDPASFGPPPRAVMLPIVTVT